MKPLRFQNGQKEDIVKILNISNGSFLFVGQKGTVISCDSSLGYESRTALELCSNAETEYCKCRKMRMATFAVTDASYLDVSRHYCIATSNRTLHFLHVTSSDQWETFRLTDMPTIPISLENNFRESNHSQTCELFVGDHVGNIYVFTFLYPRTMLFDRSYTTEICTIHFEDLKNHRDYVVCKKLRNVHDDFVDKILHIPEVHLLLSNAKRDPKKSLVSRNRKNKSTWEVIRHKKGVTCFDADYETRLIATGSKDFLVRTWSILAPHKLQLILDGHCGVIADVRLWIARRLIMSVCKELELKIWNVESGHLLRSVLVKFTSIRREPYFGKSVLHIPEDGGTYLLVTHADSSVQVDVEEENKDDWDSGLYIEDKN